MEGGEGLVAPPWLCTSHDDPVPRRENQSQKKKKKKKKKKNLAVVGEKLKEAILIHSGEIEKGNHVGYLALLWKRGSE